MDAINCARLFWTWPLPDGVKRSNFYLK